jgi:hypothetical protein
MKDKYIVCFCSQQDKPDIAEEIRIAPAGGDVLRKSVKSSFSLVFFHSGCKAGSEPIPNYFFPAGLQTDGCTAGNKITAPAYRGARNATRFSGKSAKNAFFSLSRKQSDPDRPEAVLRGFRVTRPPSRETLYASLAHPTSRRGYRPRGRSSEPCGEASARVLWRNGSLLASQMCGKFGRWDDEPARRSRLVGAARGASDQCI